MQIKNSVFLVTGGASGLGAATARMAAENGGKVVIADMQADVGEKLARELGACARFARTDVTSEADGKGAVDLAQKEFGGLQVLVNCAGIGKFAHSHEMPCEDWARIIGVNLTRGPLDRTYSAPQPFGP